MNRTCTCGATAPVDAQFCPRCGRPLDGAPDEPLTPEVVLPVPTPDASAGPPPIGFGNPQAVRSALLASVVAVVLGNLPLVGILCFIWYPGAGFLSVYNYRRRTGLTPTTSEGAKLGWITGVFTFVISLATLALVFLVPRQDGSVVEIIRQQISEYPAQEELKRQMLELLDNPSALAILVLIYLAMFFVLVAGLTPAGGALGAKVLEED